MRQFQIYVNYKFKTTIRALDPHDAIRRYCQGDPPQGIKIEAVDAEAQWEDQRE